jgi:hypothetical protein
MPLNLASLRSDLQALFANPPLTTSEAAEKWADAMERFTIDIVPASTTVAVKSAARALKGALAGMELPGAAIGVFSVGFGTFASAVAAGMTPPGVLPPSPFVFPVVVTDQPAAAASVISAGIDVWMRTGTSAPPASTPWA